MTTMAALGVVAIGRNEGARLGVCLQSALRVSPHVLYVDSGSRDDSVAVARALGAEVLELDDSRTFTAARARNEGFAWLRAHRPELELVQFLDGDSELEPDFMPKALAHLDTHPRSAAVCGLVRERHPEQSVYNRLCQIEWQAPVGKTLSCGGTLLVRAQAFEEAGGFAAELIAGEEPDLCARWAVAGWQVWRIDAPMAIHDAAITRFEQWWIRNMRSGHAASQALSRAHLRDERHVREVVSNVVWALPPAWPLWPVLWCRVYLRKRDPAYATFIVLGKLPHCAGQLKFWMEHLRGEEGALIEYK
jgi:GT2 family glycosyltransferase